MNGNMGSLSLKTVILMGKDISGLLVKGSGVFGRVRTIFRGQVYIEGNPQPYDPAYLYICLRRLSR